ncbi:hypothetical protein DM01DRAFT_1403669 [Hesseltinella vesiculosa]|uniref:Uncharacterized protein n=1 Tax=Hesseltinella vesiculosa TaxID=101127 RepID=A0A1X2GV68_9FUNG|nr:hypothetical protein DM01DRAFT_1403669 [Hesseltinella vesiculosa]
MHTEHMSLKKRKSCTMQDEPWLPAEEPSTKRCHTEYGTPESMKLDDDIHDFVAPCFMPPAHSVHLSSNATTQAYHRPTTPPLSMTLAHYSESAGGYTQTQVKSSDHISSSICTGMTPVYRAPTDRWGSCLI